MSRKRKLREVSLEICNAGRFQSLNNAARSVRIPSPFCRPLTVGWHSGSRKKTTKQSGVLAAPFGDVVNHDHLDCIGKIPGKNNPSPIHICLVSVFFVIRLPGPKSLVDSFRNERENFREIMRGNSWRRRRCFFYISRSNSIFFLFHSVTLPSELSTSFYFFKYNFFDRRYPRQSKVDGNCLRLELHVGREKKRL